MYNIETIVELLKSAALDEENNLENYKNEKSKNYSELIDIFSNKDNISLITLSNLTDDIAPILANLFDEKDYIYYINNLTDLINLYDNYKNTMYLKYYDEILNEILRKLIDAKKESDKKAEEEYDLKVGGINRYIEIISKISQNKLLDQSDIILISNLFIDKSYEESFELYDAIDRYNLSLNLATKKEQKVKKNVSTPSVDYVKILFDSKFINSDGTPIEDSNGNTVYDCLPERYKIKLNYSYISNSNKLQNLLSIIFNNPEFSFMKTYGTTFSNPKRLLKEQTILCLLLLNADYDLLNGILQNDCKKYGYTMEELIKKLKGVYKHESKSSGNGGSLEGHRSDELYIPGNHETYRHNVDLLEGIDVDLPKIVFDTNSEVLLTPKDRFLNNLNIINSIWKEKNIGIITSTPLLLSSTDLENNIYLFEEYKISRNQNVVPSLAATDIKNRINLLIEAGLYDYIKKYPSGLVRNDEFIKKFYYGNSNRDNGFEEMQLDNNMHRLEVTGKGIKDAFDGYEPTIAIKHYGDYDNFSKPELLLKYRSYLPKDMLLYIDDNYSRFIPIEKKKHILDFPVIKLLDEKYKKDEYIYDIDGILISRKKVIDVMYLYEQFCINMFEKADKTKKNDDIKSILDITNKDVYLVNALTYNSNCSHYALIKIINAVTNINKEISGNLNYESDFKDILESGKKKKLQ